MSSRRISYTSAIAVLAGVLALMTGLVGPAQAATARVLTLTVSPTHAVGGTQITYSGAVSKTGTGQSIRLQRKVGTSWVTVKTGTTTTGGKYSITATLTSTAGLYTWRTAAPAKGTLATAYSRAVNVRSLGPAPSADDIDDARREMLGSGH